MPILPAVFAVVAGSLSGLMPSSQSRSEDPAATHIYTLIDESIENGSIAGAQVVLGEHDGPLETRSFGVRDVMGRKPIDADTRFCIGSCSKMLAGAVLVSLAAEKTVDLDVPIDRWLEGFTNPRLATGEKASRAPTLRELLCHRGGIYSQRNRMTKEQARWIRDFTISLADAVSGIAAEPLSVEPGQEFAYSGAGYCVLGRVAEVAAGRPFDELLKHTVSRPLKLTRTTYFPPVDDENVAVGHAIQNGKLAEVPLTPHLLAKQLKLPLIGGSVYAPARELAEFARMLLQKGRWQNREVVSPAQWQEMTELHSPQPGGGYGLGLFVSVDAKTGNLRSLSHSGALFGSFSHVIVDYRTGRFGVVNLTGDRNRAVRQALHAWASP